MLDMLNGVFHLPWWGVLLVAFGFTHFTAMSISLYLHRHSAHRALELHPILSHFFRFWLWLTTGMETKAWTAIHRKHHARCETPDDPHSPIVLGLKKVLLEGAELYRKEAKNQETMTRYGQGTPDDWIERNIYTKHSAKGILLMFLINVALFGPIGITIWAMQMAWTPLCAAGIINGIGHYFGYRNFESNDAATNVVPWGFMIMGEELHNNHHTFATSAKFSVKPWEFDMGWFYIRLFSLLGLAKAKRTPPELFTNPSKHHIDLETVKALLHNRFSVMAQYSRNVLLPVFKEMRQKHKAKKIFSRQLWNTLSKNDCLVRSDLKSQMLQLIENYDNLKVVYQFRNKLQSIWEKTTTSQRELIDSLQDWCKQAEMTRIQVLQDFAASVRTFSLQPA